MKIGPPSYCCYSYPGKEDEYNLGYSESRPPVDGYLTTVTANESLKNERAMAYLTNAIFKKEQYLIDHGGSRSGKDNIDYEVLGHWEIFGRSDRGIFLQDDPTKLEKDCGAIISFSAGGEQYRKDMSEKLNDLNKTRAGSPGQGYEYFLIVSDPTSSDNKRYKINEKIDKPEEFVNDEKLSPVYLPLMAMCNKLGVQKARVEFYLKQVRRMPSMQTAIVAIPGKYFYGFDLELDSGRKSFYVERKLETHGGDSTDEPMGD